MLYKNYKDAFQAAKKMRDEHVANGIMVKIEKSPYGGFVLKLIPTDLVIDNLSGNLPNKSFKKQEICA